VGGAETLGLCEDLGVGQETARLFRDILATGPDHHRHARDPGLPHGRERMREHRTACDLVQDLGTRRFHPRPLASRQHDGETGSGSGLDAAGRLRHCGLSLAELTATYQEFAAIRNA
jgi:hypothetical protein